MTPRRRLYLVLDNRPGDAAGRAVALALQALIAANVLAVILESVPELDARFAAAFKGFAVVSMLLFSVEYAARLWTAVEAEQDRADPLWARLRYAATPLALIDLATLAAFYLGAVAGADLRWMRVLRLVGLLKFTRYSPALVTAADVVRAEAGGLLAALFIFAVALVLAAAGMYAFEHELQPDNFGSIPKALYWGVVTLTTLGYGDVVPLTWGGRAFAGLVAFAGIAMVAFPSAILASGFIRQLRLHSDEIRGPSITAEAARLGLSEEDTARLVGAVLGEAALQVCPHCGQPLDHTVHGPPG